MRIAWQPIALLAVILAVSGCKPGREEGGPDAIQSVYRHAMDGGPSSLDPAQASNIYANFLAVNLYDTLYRYKYLARPYRLEPNLADGLPQVSADGLIYTIRIKPGVHFIDDAAFHEGKGRAVRASDFVYSLKRHFDPATRAQGAWLWQGRIVGLDDWKENGADYDEEVSGLRAVDDRTIQIQLISPFPQLTHTLAQGYSAIVPREAVEHHGPEFAVNPVGSGPYRLLSFNSSGAVLERNPGFRREPFSLEAEGYDPARQADLGLEALSDRTPPFADRVEVEVVAEDAARWNAFIAGEVDLPLLQWLAGRGPVALDIQGFVRVPRKGDLRFEVWPDLAEGLKHVTYLKTDRAEAELLTGQTDLHQAARRLASFGPREVVITESSGVTTYANDRFYHASFRPRSQVGRTGRGDTCFAAYLTQRLRHDPDTALQFAAALTSLKMETPGPFQGSLEDGKALLMTNSPPQCC